MIVFLFFFVGVSEANTRLDTPQEGAFRRLGGLELRPQSSGSRVFSAYTELVPQSPKAQERPPETKKPKTLQPAITVPLSPKTLKHRNPKSPKR